MSKKKSNSEPPLAFEQQQPEGLPDETMTDEELVVWLAQTLYVAPSSAFQDKVMQDIRKRAPHPRKPAVNSRVRSLFAWLQGRRKGR